MAEDYSHFVHRHRFASWAAARAAQRGWAGGKVAAIVAAIERSDLPRFLQTPETWPTEAGAFDAVHRQWCQAILGNLLASSPSTTFGRVAKVVAVYLKGMVVVGPDFASGLAKVIHPPIDGRLLKAIAEDPCVDSTIREACRSTNWTDLDENTYYTMIAAFRECGMDQPAFWMLERYWTPADAE
ncbi:MAG: hypothetical protein BIFFINMI_00319 [Phycisphaerae bacterium]|nr:hypothetical protein [Phycisphaerae bacterium]